MHHQVDEDGVEAQGVGGRAGVVPRILCFDRAEHEGTVGHDEPVAVLGDWDG